MKTMDGISGLTTAAEDEAKYGNIAHDLTHTVTFAWNYIYTYSNGHFYK